MLVLSSVMQTVVVVQVLQEEVKENSVKETVGRRCPEELRRVHLADSLLPLGGREGLGCQDHQEWCLWDL